MKKYVSYSELALFNRDIDEYKLRYLEGKYPEPNPEMKLGSTIHAVMENEKYDWLKELRELGYTGRQILPIRKALTKLEHKRAPEREVKLGIDLCDDIRLFAVFDGLDRQSRVLDEYKTSRSADAWTQWRVDMDQQLSFYALVFKQLYHSYFTEIRLHFIDVARGNVKTFKTTRGPRDIEQAKQWTIETVNKMKRSGIWEKRLSKADIAKQNQGVLGISPELSTRHVNIPV